MRVLVTGGAGFIGSHLVDRLLAMGYGVRVLDNLSSNVVDPRGFWGERVEFVRCDLSEPSSACLEAFRGVDIVFHMAANPEVRVSTVEPGVHFRHNVVATWHALEASRSAGVRAFVFASSSTVYGDPRRIPTPEDHELDPISVYGACKASGEALVRSYSRLYGFRGLILRYANIVGPRLRHGVIWDFIGKLRRDPRRLEILGDGTQRKSYLYITDAVDATLAALERLMEGGEDVLVYNVGNRDWVTVREIADAVVEAMGLQGVEYTYRPGTPDGRGWPGDVKLMLLDITRITRDTGWQPRLSSLEAVRRTARALVEQAP